MARRSSIRTIAPIFLEFYPLPGALNASIDLSPFNLDLGWNEDFNANPQTGRFYGAYSGAGANPGWRLALEIKMRKLSGMLEIIDLSQEIFPGMPVFPGLPEVEKRSAAILAASKMLALPSRNCPPRCQIKHLQ